MKGWYNLQSYLGYDATQKTSITEGENGDSYQNGGGGAYGGLSGQEGVNPFQAAMSNQNNDSSDLLDFDGSGRSEQNLSGSGWESNEWNGGSTSNDGWDNSWNNQSPAKTNNPTAAATAKTPPKMTKQDSWGNDADAWENWLNDDSSSYQSSPTTTSATKRSPRAGKKGD